MKNVIIAGSTGMVGSLVLKKCLGSSEISKVTTIDRRSSGIKHEKLTEIVQDDFLDYSDIEEVFQNIDVAFWCIGVYTGAVPRDEFRKITVDYTRAFAKMLKKHSPNATFCFLSGAGADQTEKSRVMFAKDKGAAENLLKKLEFPQAYFFRPSYIFPVIPRKEPNTSYVIMRKLYPVLKYIFPSIRSDELAKAMFVSGAKGASKMVLENSDIKGIIK